MLEINNDMYEIHTNDWIKSAQFHGVMGVVIGEGLLSKLAIPCWKIIDIHNQVTVIEKDDAVLLGGISVKYTGLLDG